MKKFITVLILAFFSQAALAQTVNFKLRYNPSACVYEAYAHANGSFGSTVFVGDAQFTIVVDGSMANSAVSGVTTPSGAPGTWSLINADTTTTNDYYAIAFSASSATTSGMSSGDSTLLFSFTLNNSTCESDVNAWTGSDPTTIAGSDYSNVMYLNFGNRYAATSSPNTSLTDPTISSLTPDCFGTTKGINLTASSANSCSGGALSYAWSGPGGFTASTEDITVQDTSTSIGTYNITITDGMGCTSSSSLDLDSTNCFIAAVPVDLLSFDGVRVNDVNKLYWSTATEVNNKNFEVQRSIDGIEFETISTVPSKAIGGNSNSNLDYTYSDYTVYPTGIVVFYKLKQVDYDNTSALYGPVKISIEESNTVGLYPNPANGEVHIVGLQQDFDYTVTLTDVIGKTIIYSDVSIDKSTINTKNLSNGMYNVTVSDGDGMQSTTKLVISH